MEKPIANDIGWTPSVYYAESVVNCSAERAWSLMLDYEAWNPTFAGADVTLMRGKPRSEGELVLIQKRMLDVNGQPQQAFYAETVKVVPQQHLVWYVYRNEGDAFRNFVDFGLSELPTGVRFNIYYYAQHHMSEELWIKKRQLMETGLQDLATAFKKYCESNA